MPDAGQFSFGLSDTDALGWTIHTPTAAPAPFPPALNPDDGDTPPPEAAPRGTNFHLDAERTLARGWPARARDNLVAIRLSKELEASGRSPTAGEQEVLLRFVGFGATELAQNCFPLPGATNFRAGWEETGRALQALASPAEYSALCRSTQYAHFTPEPVVRALWRAARQLGFAGGRVLEPGMGTGLFFALLPPELRGACRLTGIEYDPITARIARLVHPEATVRCEDYTRSRLAGGFDLAIGNPPFADRIVRADPATAAPGLRLHDHFIASSIARLRPGGLVLFVTSTGTMDKASTAARQHIAGMADLVAAVRLPEGSLRATAGTDVVVDVLVFQRRAEGQQAGGKNWIDLAEISVADQPDTAADDDAPADNDITAPTAPVVAINAYFAAHPEMVLGTHALRRGIHGPGLTYTCRARPGTTPLETLLDAALSRLPRASFFSAIQRRRRMRRGSSRQQPPPSGRWRAAAMPRRSVVKQKCRSGRQPGERLWR